MSCGLLPVRLNPPVKLCCRWVSDGGVGKRGWRRLTRTHPPPPTIPPSSLPYHLPSPVAPTARSVGLVKIRWVSGVCVGHPSLPHSQLTSPSHQLPDRREGGGLGGIVGDRGEIVGLVEVRMGGLIRTPTTHPQPPLTNNPTTPSILVHRQPTTYRPTT